MSERLFASVYIDECIPYILAGLLKKEGWSVTSVFDEGTVGEKDIDQLMEAVKRQSVFVTTDKRTFLKETKGQSHKGIIIIQRTVALDNLAAVQKKISELLNRYTADEFENVVFYISF